MPAPAGHGGAEGTWAARAVRVMPDGRRAVAAFHDGTVRVWDLVWRAEVATLVGHTGAVGRWS